MTKLIPLEDHIIVETIQEENKTPSGIVLPDTTKEKPWKGKVIAVGEGKIWDDGKRLPIDVKIWDIVFFTKYSPDEIEIEEDGQKKKYLVIRHSSILAKHS